MAEVTSTMYITEAPVTPLIDYNNFTPYLATIDRNTSNINYKSLTDMGVVGVMIEAGYLYDVSGLEVYNYRNPKLDSQIAAADKVGMPYALFSITRAKTIEAANKEIYQLSLCIRKYPPQLGFWLRLGLTKSKSINNQIVNIYYDALVKLGLKNRVGIYITEAQLTQIDWGKHRDKWYLWLDNHVKVASDIGTLVMPNFFERT